MISFLRSHLTLLSLVVGAVVVTTVRAEDTASSVQYWWDTTVSEDDKAHLSSLFDDKWFNNEIDEATRAAYAFRANEMYEFLESGADSHPDDSYIGFAPLLLRASFHGAGTFDHATGIGGSNGGTIFNQAELADEQNGCIDIAANELFGLFHGSNTGVGLADTMVIAGVVALDTMDVSDVSQRFRRCLCYPPCRSALSLSSPAFNH